MEKRVFSSLLFLLGLLVLSHGLSSLPYQCPSSTGTLVSGIFPLNLRQHKSFLTITVTSATQVYSLLVSYVAYQPNFGKIYGGSYTFQNYDQFPTQVPRSVSHSPQVLIDQLWARINGLSGFIINSNPNEISFDAGDFISVYTIFNGYTCIQCSQTEIWNSTDCINRCISGKVFLNGNCVCPDNTEWNSFGCVFCTGGKVWNSLSRTCSCPTNLIWNGVSCITCDGGKIYDSNAKDCACPLGSNWNGISCTTACPPPHFWNSTILQCQCQFNLVWNGADQDVFEYKDPKKRVQVKHGRIVKK